VQALLALQINTNDPLFWILVVIAISFVVIALATVFIAVLVGRMARAVGALEKRVEPLIERATALGEEARRLAAQGREIAAQLHEMSGHLSTATMHLAESAAIVRDEVREIKALVSHSVEAARDKVEMIGRSIDETHAQVVATTRFIQARIVDPARELAAIMAGIRRGLEVLTAPSPKPLNQSYGEDEMFIG